MSDNQNNTTAQPRPSTLALVVQWMGTIGAALAAAVLISTFLPGAAQLPPLVTSIWLLAVALPISWLAMFLGGNDRLLRSTAAWKELRSVVPRSVGVAATVVQVMAVLVVGTTMLTGGSDLPMITGGGYDVVTEAGYTQALIQKNRINSGGALILHAGTVVLAGAAARRPRS